MLSCGLYRLYLFVKVQLELSFGGACVFDTVSHIKYINDMDFDLPFLVEPGLEVSEIGGAVKVCSNLVRR